MVLTDAFQILQIT